MPLKGSSDRCAAGATRSVVTRKKAFERFLADQFLRAGSFAPSSLEDHESPDFIAVIAGDRIGLEITQMFGELAGGDDKVSAEALMHRIVGKAQRIYVESGARAAHVVVTFAANVDVRSLNRDEVARQLADVVGGLDLPPFETINARVGSIAASRDCLSSCNGSPRVSYGTLAPDTERMGRAHDSYRCAGLY